VLPRCAVRAPQLLEMCGKFVEKHGATVWAVEAEHVYMKTQLSAFFVAMYITAYMGYGLLLWMGRVRPIHSPCTLRIQP